MFESNCLCYEFFVCTCKDSDCIIPVSNAEFILKSLEAYTNYLALLSHTLCPLLCSFEADLPPF